jgi:ribosomal protein L11 methylase PrmA
MAQIITLILELFGVGVLLVIIYFLGRPIMRGAIYFPTTGRGVEAMLKLADIKPGQKVVDLGSGDGRILIAAARAGAQATGYEINPILVRQSRRAIARAGLAPHATVEWESFWRADFSQYDIVIVYGIPYILRGLRRKMERELRPGTKIISNAFEIPGWPIVAKEHKVFLYIKE